MHVNLAFYTLDFITCVFKSLPADNWLGVYILVEDSKRHLTCIWNLPISAGLWLTILERNPKIK